MPVWQRWPSEWRTRRSRSPVSSLMPGSTQTMVSEGGNNLTTVIVQTVCAAIERKDTDYGPLTGLLRVEEAKSI
eukprot:5307994-Prymnesium_polylepis.1